MCSIKTVKRFICSIFHFDRKRKTILKTTFILVVLWPICNVVYFLKKYKVMHLKKVFNFINRLQISTTYLFFNFIEMIYLLPCLIIVINSLHHLDVELNCDHFRVSAQLLEHLKEIILR